MTKPISAAAASSIEAAISRLMGSGDVQATFTIARLASEAGLSRATLYRAPELLERFRIAIASHQREVKSPPSPTDRVHQLEAEIAALHGRETEELRALRSSNRNMAQHIQALSLLVRQQQQRIARLQAEPSESGRVATLVARAAAPVR
jgi:AcrR family transcriptional regulator